MNRFPVCRIANTKDESTLVGCIGQPSEAHNHMTKTLLHNSIYCLVSNYGSTKGYSCTCMYGSRGTLLVFDVRQQESHRISM